MQEISLEELKIPQFLKPKLRLFLSVDIVGSTAFKQSTPKNLNSTEISPAWFRATTNFYREIDRLFIQEWRALDKENQTDYSWPSGDEPNLWKSAGDELIYTVQVKDYRHVAVYVIAWKRAAEKFRPAIKKFSKSLDLKLTGWIAGFPVINHELILRSGQSEDMIDDDDSVVANFRLLQKFESNTKGLIKDYIGPSIDNGFRLGGHATPRKFILSIDLALLLAKCIQAWPQVKSLKSDVKFFYDQRACLKGVMGGVPYPLFWIDNNTQTNNLEILEDKFNNRTDIAVSDVFDYCMRFIHEMESEVLIKPYIYEENDSFFNEMPSEHREFITKYNAYWQEEEQKREVESASDNQPIQYEKKELEYPSLTLAKTIIELINKSKK